MPTNNLIDVGDIVQVDAGYFGKWQCKIARVTKTLAISEPINNAGAALKFRRLALQYIPGEYWLRLIGAGKWDQTTYIIKSQLNVNQS